jgi:hypothetical protein
VNLDAARPIGLGLKDWRGLMVSGARLAWLAESILEISVDLSGFEYCGAILIA